MNAYLVELVTAVSKYIGETEKNLDRVFAAAETVAVLLFLDEADALFGRRAEVPDARNRYSSDRGRSILLAGIVAVGMLRLCLSFRHWRPSLETLNAIQQRGIPLTPAPPRCRFRALPNDYFATTMCTPIWRKHEIPVPDLRKREEPGDDFRSRG